MWCSVVFEVLGVVCGVWCMGCGMWCGVLFNVWDVVWCMWCSVAYCV